MRCPAEMESSWLGRAVSAAAAALIAGLVRGENAADGRVKPSPNMADPPWPQRFSARRPALSALRPPSTTAGSWWDGAKRDNAGTDGTDVTTDTPTSRRPKGCIEVRLPIHILRSWTNRQNTRFRVSQRGSYHPTLRSPNSSLRNQNGRPELRTPPFSGVMQHQIQHVSGMGCHEKQLMARPQTIFPSPDGRVLRW